MNISKFKISKFGIYSLAIGAFALALTGCGGSKDTSSSEPQLLRQQVLPQRAERRLTRRRLEKSPDGSARRRSPQDEGHQHGS